MLESQCSVEVWFFFFLAGFGLVLFPLYMPVWISICSKLWGFLDSVFLGPLKLVICIKVRFFFAHHLLPISLTNARCFLTCTKWLFWCEVFQNFSWNFSLNKVHGILLQFYRLILYLWVHHCIFLWIIGRIIGRRI